MHSVLLTGVSGFIGSKIAEILCEHKVKVIGLKRKNSALWRCKDFVGNIQFIDLDGDESWQDLAISLKPTVIIHAAWIGVEAAERDDYKMQSKNINFLIDLLAIAKEVKIDKFLFLGSQAEYGFIDGKVTEDHPAAPVNAYGAIKLASLEILKTFCAAHQITWVWLRIFSLFGEKEGENWLIPSVITNMLEGKPLNFTEGKQQYAYLYIADLANIINQIVINQVAAGVYNISSNEVHQLKTLIEEIRLMMNKDSVLNFGAIPYRGNQSMHIEGDISKIESQIGQIKFTNFNVALRHTINYYKINRTQ